MLHGWVEAAKEAKAQGNEQFAAQKFEEALTSYAAALKSDPSLHAVHSNMAACHIELANREIDLAPKVTCFARALVEAQKCTELAPQWTKGWVRRANAEWELLHALGRYNDDKGKEWNKEKPPPDPALAEVYGAAGHASIEASCRAGLAIERENLPLRQRLQALRDAGHPADEAADRALRDPEAAAVAKAQGNDRFKAKNYEAAATAYGLALAHDPLDHIFYSNRSACHAEQGDGAKALHDAERCVALAPADFVKGHSRRSAALYQAGRYADAEAAARAGLALDAGNEALKGLLKTAQLETAESPEARRPRRSSARALSPRVRGARLLLLPPSPRLRVAGAAGDAPNARGAAAEREAQVAPQRARRARRPGRRHPPQLQVHAGRRRPRRARRHDREHERRPDAADGARDRRHGRQARRRHGCRQRRGAPRRLPRSHGRDGGGGPPRVRERAARK
jgi:tetratricopeptide (TPR) repeat protein